VAVGEGGEEVRGTREDFVGWAKRSVPTLFETSGCSTLHHASLRPRQRQCFLFHRRPRAAAEQPFGRRSRSPEAHLSSRSTAPPFRDRRNLHPARSYSRALGAAGRRRRLFYALGLDKSGFSRGLDARARSTSKVAKREKGIWQRRYWEHAIRDDEDFERHVDYIHFNPVKHGHVNRIADWPHSSFHRYVERGLLAPDWAGDLRNIQGSFGEDGGHAALCPPYEATGSRHDDEPHSPLIIPASIRSRLNLRASAPFLQA